MIDWSHWDHGNLASSEDGLKFQSQYFCPKSCILLWYLESINLMQLRQPIFLDRACRESLVALDIAGA